MDPRDEQQVAFERLFRTHRSVVADYARRRVGDTAADDVVAEVFAACWRHRADLGRIDRAWLIAAARNLVLHEFRSAGRQDRLVTRIGKFAPHDDGDPIDGVAGALDTAAAVTVAMRELSGSDQEILRLLAWDQLTPREIAVVVGCSSAAARVRLHRAGRRLAAAMTAAGVSAAPSRDPLRSAP